MDPIKVLIGCNNSIVRKGIAKILLEDPGICVVGEVKGGQGVIRELDKTLPNIVLIDLYLPELNGIDLSWHITKNHPHIKTAIFTTVEPNENSVFRAVEAGASVFLDRDSSYRELVLAVRAAARDEAYLSPAISAKIVQNINNWQKNPDKMPLAATDSLTQREREVIQLIAEGLTCRQIADKLCISLNTVRRHRTSLMGKLNLKNVAEVVRFTIKNGMVDLG